MSAKTNCPYCHKEIATAALEPHIRNYCKRAPKVISATNEELLRLSQQKEQAWVQRVDDMAKSSDMTASALGKALQEERDQEHPTVVGAQCTEPEVRPDQYFTELLREAEIVAQEAAKQQEETVVDQSIPRLSSNEIGVPSPDDYFVIKQSTYRELERAEKISEIHPVNILVTGMQGSGKTSLGIQHAARQARPLVEVQCGLMSEPGQWFGGLKFSPERGTWFQESQFIKGIETPRCVVILDELNRVENPKVMNSLFWLLDTRRQAWIDDLQRRVKVADGVIFFATLNEGVIFSGIDFVDTALRDRFRVINMEFPPADDEIDILIRKIGVSKDIATILVNLAETVRKNPNLERKISTRQLLMAAEEIKFGASTKEAVEFCISNSYGEQSQDILQALQAFLPESEARGGSRDGWRTY